ncbi:MAG: hypothetical protein JNM17_35780 [Archangium sp.]|nr:hypothetical protein [Archangium sp.]
MDTKPGRWSNWMDRARTCFKAATAIDATATTVHSTLRELNGLADPQSEMVNALREAEAALERAREAVQAALKARQLTAANREVAYGLVG